MDTEYAKKLEQAANAPDEMFPEMLFEPLSTEFGDLYFKLDPADYRQEAVKVDSRFTKKNIERIRGTAKRVDRFLEWTALWDDYMEYLEATYGSVDVAYEMHLNGILPDPFPTISHRPILRKGRDRRLINKGIILSYITRGVYPDDCYEQIFDMCEKDDTQYFFGEEPDVEWAWNHKPTKEEKAFARMNAIRYRRQMRREILNAGSSIGVSANMNFVDNYYCNVQKGVYDTVWSNHDLDGTSLLSQMRAMEDKKYRHLGQIYDDERYGQGGRYVYDSHKIQDRRKLDQYEVLLHLQKYTGIDILGAMAGTVSKKRFKAIRAGFESVGGSPGLTAKEQKKLKKKQRKLERSRDRTVAADQKLADILLNNKVYMNNGTIRFEDGRRSSFDIDD